MASYLYPMYPLKLKYLLCVGLLASGVSAIAQTDKEDREEKKAIAKQKVEYNVFRRQILTLPEFGEERHKMAELQKATKTPIKVVAYVDSTNDAEDAKTLIGYIRENVGDNSTDIYEITFDRALKKIMAVRPTGETVEIEKDEKEKPAKKGTVAAKKKKAEDADEDEEPAAKTKKPQPRRAAEEEDDE